ncbi:MAG: hypothetical protein JWN35_2533 [Frankiales bacterium]|jgi:hypothetical protein|nr:hypothetical protein [Frankiales bacterium]
MTTSPTRRTNLRDALSSRFADRRRHADLVRQLSEYRTARERAEIDAMLSRHTAEEGAKVQAALTALAHQQTALACAGR